MRTSFIRLVAGFVVLSWSALLGMGMVYARLQSWTDDRAKTDGVFLVHELLAQERPQDRRRRLDELQGNFSVDFELLPVERVQEHIGRALHPGEQVPHRVSLHEEWYFLAFADGSKVLAAGPVDPALPAGGFPIGLVGGLLVLPLLAGALALVVERSMRRVEQASDALAGGDFSARVEDAAGPSAELAVRFNAMAERVERLIEDRDELVQAVSHELGSPLTRLRLHLELLEGGEDDGRSAPILAMTRELDVLDELVAELMSYVQFDNVALQRRVFEVHQVLGDLAELAMLEAVEATSVEVHVTGGEGVAVFADPRAFQRTVENLLRNAVRYAQQEVRVEVSEEDNGLRVAVHDDGPGIAEELREKVLAPFIRIDDHRGRAGGGAGLGLAIVQRIVARHGGRLAIRTSPLGGAVVETWWPSQT